MNAIRNVVKERWHWILALGLFSCEVFVLLLFRENMYVAICDNLDLFITQLKMLRDNGAFFAHNQSMPILGGIDRNYFPTEFSLYNMLYLILPDIYAYIAGFALKLAIAACSCVLLAKYVLKERYKEYEKIIVLVSAAFAVLPLYPMYALCFASMPLILYLLLRIYKEPKWWLYLAAFLYPMLSYFTFFGAFILGYTLIAFVILWMKDKKPPLRLIGAFAALMAGFVCFEYRLFGIMLFSGEETIRSTMVIADYGLKGVWDEFINRFLNGFPHAKSLHAYFVLPVCVLYFMWNNMCYITKKKHGNAFADAFNLTILFILFNCAAAALYLFAPMRNLVEALIPPLKGFHYGRAVFFNAFAWYFAFFIAVKNVFQKSKIAAYAACIPAILIVVGTQCEYSDFYNTCYCNLYKLIKHKDANQLSYGEFYGASLMEEIKQDIGYTPDKGACVYGFHPAMLEYNGITTIDGYCGYYSQNYKEKFRAAIAPTLDASKVWQKYYDEWACRAYLFSASGENTYDFGANSDAPPQDILIDEQSLKQLGCDYIFSRMEITNSDEMNLRLINVYNNEEMPYSVYLYGLE